MIPGPRQKCAQPACRHTRPANPEAWACPRCKARLKAMTATEASREKAITAAERQPSVVYLAQREGISVGEYCRRLGRLRRSMGNRPQNVVMQRKQA